MSEECNKVCREIMTKERLYEKLNSTIRQSAITSVRGEARYDALMEVKRFLDDYFEDLKENEPEKESIPYLMHKELDIPLSDCQKAYDVAIDYLRKQGKVSG